jgi:hypothetical protein
VITWVGCTPTQPGTAVPAATSASSLRASRGSARPVNRRPAPIEIHRGVCSACDRTRRGPAQHRCQSERRAVRTSTQWRCAGYA